MTIYEFLTNSAPSENRSYISMRHDDIDKLPSDEDKAVYEKIYKIVMLVNSIHLSSLNVKKNEKAKFVTHADSHEADQYLKAELTDADMQVINGLDLSKIPEVHREHVSLCLWLRNGDLAEARWFADYHFKRFQRLFDPSEWLQPWESIEKAVVTADLLKDKNLLSTYIADVESRLNQMNGTDEWFMSLSLIELLCLYKPHPDYQNYIALIDKSLATKTDKPNREEGLIKLRIDIAGKMKDPAIILESHKLAVNEYERRGDEDKEVALRAADDYKKAISHCTAICGLKLTDPVLIAEAEAIGRKQKELEHKLAETEKASLGQMTTFKYTLNVTEINKQQDEYFKDLDFEESVIQMIRLIRFRTKDEIKQDVLKRAGTFASIFPQQILGKDGRVVATLPGLMPDADEDTIRKYMILAEREYEQNYSTLSLLYQMQLLREKSFTIDDIKKFLDDNAIVPEGRSKIIAQGFYYGLTGDMYLAMHILPSEMENVFRHIAIECGDDVYGLNKDFVTEQFDTLTGIFSLEKLNECFDSDILFIFDEMMNQPIGANMRNHSNHGMMDERDAYSGNVIYFFCACMKLLFQCSREYVYFDRGRLEKLNKNYEEGQKIKIDPESIYSRQE